MGGRRRGGKRETRKPGGKGHVEDASGDSRARERRVFERRGREIPRAIYGMVIEILRTGLAFAKHVHTRDLPSRETAAPRRRARPAAAIRALVVFLARNNTKLPMSS